MDDLTPWLALAALGAFHGINPAMGWLFAVALGMHRQQRSIVALSLIPIAIGHAVSICFVAAAAILLGLAIEQRATMILTGVILVTWAVYHVIYGHRGRVRIGLQTGLGSLAVWSFLMATSHGAGLMLVPVLIPLCFGSSPAKEFISAGSLSVSLAAIAVHTAAMLVVTAAMAALVYEWIGLAILRRGWINLDLVWSAALVVAGAVLLLSA